MFFRAFRHEAFDVSELSFSSYCVKRAQDASPYVAIPVFLSRAFRHSSIYIRTDKGIESPSDLKGRRIGIAEWQLTANVWARGILEDYGVVPSDIKWVRGGMHTPGRPEKIAISLPDDVDMAAAPEGATLDQMLRDGEIEGFIGPRSLRCFDEGHPHVGRLFLTGSRRHRTIMRAQRYSLLCMCLDFARVSLTRIHGCLALYSRPLADLNPWHRTH